jgi:hypothetical protein
MESVSTADLGKVAAANDLQGRLGFDRD